MSLACDLPAHHDHTSLCHRLAGNLGYKHWNNICFLSDKMGVIMSYLCVRTWFFSPNGCNFFLIFFYLCVRILLEMSVQDCVRHLVAHLVCEYSIFISSANINIPYSLCLPMLLLLLLSLITSCLPIFKVTNVPMILRSEISSLVHLSMQKQFSEPWHGREGVNAKFQFIPVSPTKLPLSPVNNVLLLCKLRGCGWKTASQKIAFPVWQVLLLCHQQAQVQQHPQFPCDQQTQMLLSNFKQVYCITPPACHQ